MTTDNLPTRTVSAEVVGHKMHNGKPITELDIPEWNSKYPTVIYGVSEQHQTQLPMGETVVVMLKADRVRDGTDGSKPWHFFWSILSIGGEVPAPKQQQPEQPRLSEEPQGWSEDEKAAIPLSPRRIDTDTAIRRAVALKAAVDYIARGGATKQSTCYRNRRTFDEWLGRPV